MSIAKGKNALLVASSYYGPFYPDGKNTGVHFSELLIPYNVFKKAGFNVQFVSENGSYKFDDHSIEESKLGDFERKVFNDKNDDFWTNLNNMKKASDIVGKDYQLLFVAGGHAAMFDLPKATNLQAVAREVFTNGGVLSAVCHGPVLLANVKNPQSVEGKTVVYHKHVTAFNKAGEEKMGVMDELKKRGMKSLNEIFTEAGATFIDPPNPNVNFTQIDGKIVTGVNPQSAKSTAEAAVSAL
ncbi:D-lactate dehydratase [Schizosaccharomyces pombe]